MSEESDVELCIEPCELTFLSSTIVTDELTSEVYEKYNMEGKSLKNYFKREENKTPLPIANPYIAAYLIVVVSAAVISNCIVLLVMGVRRKKLQPFQWCLISVCVSDLLFSLLLHPMSIATSLGYDAHEIFNQSGCTYFGVLALFFGSYDMVIHSLIAVLRYIYLCHPERTIWSSTSTVSILLTISALYSAFWSIGPLFGFGKYVTFEVGCTMDFRDDTLSGKAFVNCAFVFIFFVPLIITIICYVAIVMKVAEQRNELKRMGTVSSRGNNTLVVEIKLIRLTSVIAAAYIVVWFPYAVVCLVETYGYKESIPWIFRILAALFCKTGCATNPVIYLFMSKEFRRDIIETLTYFLRAEKRNAAPKILLDSSQKSSSCPSTSQMSLQSSKKRTKKETLSLKRIIDENAKTSEEISVSSIRRLETSV